MEFRDVVAARHSAYSLDDDIGSAGVTMDDVLAALRSVAPDVPSSFNSQSARMVLLAGEDHRRFWALVEDVLRGRSGDPEAFRSTEAKMRGFSRAAGTVLFYDYDPAVEAMAEAHPRYADAFPTWAEHGNAMMQYAAWLTMYDLGLGANIQHYNPVIDARVAEEFGIPEGYRLVAQLVFGRVDFKGERKRKLPGEDIVALGHAKE